MWSRRRCGWPTPCSWSCWVGGWVGGRAGTWTWRACWQLASLSPLLLRPNRATPLVYPPPARAPSPQPQKDASAPRCLSPSMRLTSPPRASSARPHRAPRRGCCRRCPAAATPVRRARARARKGTRGASRAPWTPVRNAAPALPPLKQERPPPSHHPLTPLPHSAPPPPTLLAATPEQLIDLFMTLRMESINRDIGIASGDAIRGNVGAVGLGGTAWGRGGCGGEAVLTKRLPRALPERCSALRGPGGPPLPPQLAAVLSGQAPTPLSEDARGEATRRLARHLLKKAGSRARGRGSARS
jgi:hypothetical protein